MNLSMQLTLKKIQMLKFNPVYVIEGCPFEVSLTAKNERPVIIYYGRQKMKILSNESITFIANKKYSTIRYRVKKGIFYKRYSMNVIVHTFKSQGLDDLPRNLSGSVEVNAIYTKLTSDKLNSIDTSLTIRQNSIEFRNTKTIEILTPNLFLNKINLNINRPKIGIIDKSFQRKSFEEFENLNEIK